MAPGTQLPTTGLSYTVSTLQANGLPSNMCILKGFWAITSTVSGSGDQGADPNKLVAIIDPLSATSPAAGENFRTVRAAGFSEVLRGVSFTPGSR